MKAGQSFLAAIMPEAAGNLQVVVLNLQNIVVSLNALNAALTAALANIANANG